MLKYILPLIPKHSIYVEPYFGGGAVFFAKEPAKVEFINDHDAEVINFYYVLKRKFKALKKEIDVTLHSEHQQKQAKEIYRNPSGHSEVKRVWALWVLSHQSFYSILTNTWRCSKSRSLGMQIQGRKETFDERYTSFGKRIMKMRFITSIRRIFRRIWDITAVIQRKILKSCYNCYQT
jgi:DNA adenine methylase